MFSYSGSFLMGHPISNSDAIAAGSSADEDKLHRLSFIEALSMAGKEGMFRQKAKPAVPPASTCTIGFTVGVDRASASESSSGSMAGEGSESSNIEGPAATVDHSVVQEDITRDLEEAEDDSKIPHRQAVLGVPGEPVGLDELTNMSPDLAARPEANPVGFSMSAKELTPLDPPSGSDISTIKALPRMQHVEGSSVEPLQLRHAASPPQHAEVSSTDVASTLEKPLLQMRANVSAQVPFSVLDGLRVSGSPYTRSPPRHAALSSTDIAFTFDRLHSLMPANMPAEVPVSVIDRLFGEGSPDTARPSSSAAQSSTDAAFTLDRLHSLMPDNMPEVPVSEVDRLLNGGSSVTQRCSRRKFKSPPPPRTKNTRSRRSKQMLPDLRQPLLSRPSSAHTLDAAEAADGDTPLRQGNTPQQAVDSQPCGGLWQKLGSSLSAVWRWLCKSGSSLKRLSRKVLKKLLAALGLSHAEVQALVVEQQAAEREVLAVSPIVPLPQCHVEQPQGPSRRQRWRM